MRDKSGRYRWYLEKILPRISDGGEFMGLIASATDITPLKEAELLMSQANEELEKEVARRTAQLEKLMMTDPLTGVGNRRYLNGRLEVEIERAHRYQRALTAVFLDLDHFKHVNDTYGHAVGDLVLVKTAETLQRCLRECDILGRVGGEEFIALLPDTPLEQAATAVERWRAEFAALSVGEHGVKVAVSAGIAQLAPEEEGEALLKRCDEALYRAKNEGRNCVRLSLAPAKA
ncbi:MAG: GGDEF domain-containing protein [Rhodocyclales bacterium]|nr:GGDEF domain-containing protein [Rhodocyclales bacterium]